MVGPSESLSSSTHSFVWDPSIPGYRSQGKPYENAEEAKRDAKLFAHNKGLDAVLGIKTLDRNITPIEFRGKWQVSLLIPKHLVPSADSASKVASSKFNLIEEMPLDAIGITAAEFMTFKEFRNLILAKAVTPDGREVRDPVLDQVALDFFKKKSAELEQLKLKTIEHLTSCQTMLDQIVAPENYDERNQGALTFKVGKAKQFLTEIIQELGTITTNLFQEEAVGESSLKLFDDAQSLYEDKNELLLKTPLRDLSVTLALLPPPNRPRTDDGIYEFIWNKFFDHLLKNGGTQLASNFLNIYIQNFPAERIQSEKEAVIRKFFNESIRPKIFSIYEVERLAGWNTLIRIRKERPSDSNTANLIEEGIYDFCFRSTKPPFEERSLEGLNKIKELALTLNERKGQVVVMLRNLVDAFAKFYRPQMKSIDEIISFLKDIAKEESGIGAAELDVLIKELAKDLYKKYEFPQDLKKSLESSSLNLKSPEKDVYRKAMNKFQENINIRNDNDLWEVKKTGPLHELIDEVYPKKSFFEIQDALDKLKSNDTIMKELIADLKSNLSPKEFVEAFPNIITMDKSRFILHLQDYYKELLNYISFVAPPGQEIELKRALFMKLFDTLPSKESFMVPIIGLYPLVLQKGKMEDENVALIEKRAVEAFKEYLKKKEDLKAYDDHDSVNSFSQEIQDPKMRAELCVAWIEYVAFLEGKQGLPPLTKRFSKSKLEQMAKNIPAEIDDEKRGNLRDYAMQLVQKIYAT